MLAARPDRLRNVFGLGGGHHEDDVRRRLFQGLEQGVEGGVGDLVGFVENINLIAVARGTIPGGVAQFANLIDAAIGGGVDLDHVHGPAGAYFDTGFAHSTGFWRRIGGRAAVERHGQNAGNRGLADTPVTAEDIAVRDALLLNGVFQGAGHVLLPDHLGKPLRTVFSRQYLIAHRNLDYTLAGDFRFSSAISTQHSAMKLSRGSVNAFARECERLPGKSFFDLTRTFHG